MSAYSLEQLKLVRTAFVAAILQYSRPIIVPRPTVQVCRLVLCLQCCDASSQADPGYYKR